MNSRQITLISYLTTHDRADVADLAQVQDVSTRTIRNDVAAINRILQGNGLNELAIDSAGVIRKAEDFARIHDHVDVTDFYAYRLSRQERVRLACALLVSASGYTTYADVAERLMASRTTIIKDLPDIRAYLGRYHLELRANPNRGIRVQGTEADCREMLLALPDRQQLYAVLGIAADCLDVVKEQISEEERESGQVLTDASFDHLCLYLCIAQLRRRVGGERSWGSVPVSERRLAMATDLDARVRRALEAGAVAGPNGTAPARAKLDDTEVRFLSAVLDRLAFVHKDASDEDAVQARFAAGRLIAEVSRDLGIDLTGDRQLFEGLTSHIASTRESGIGDVPSVAFIKEFVGENQHLYSLVEAHRDILEECYRRRLGTIELVYICMHLGAALERRRGGYDDVRVLVVCGSGAGTSQLLRERLRNYYRFQVVHVTSAHMLDEEDLNDVDLIVSTVALETPVPTVVVNPLLPDEDCLKINAVLRGMSPDAKRKDAASGATASGVADAIASVIRDVCGSAAEGVLREITRRVRVCFGEDVGVDEDTVAGGPVLLADILTPAFIRTGVMCATPEEAIQRAGDVLREAGCVTQGYIDAIVDVYHTAGPYFVFCPGFAFPHSSPDQGGKRLGMSLVRLETPVCFGNSYDPVEFVCMLSVVDRDAHLPAFFNLVTLLHNQAFLDALASAHNSEQIAEVIRTFEGELER